MSLLTDIEPSPTQQFGRWKNLSFLSRVCHQLSLLYRLALIQYTYMHASVTRPSIPWLPLFYPPDSDESAPLYGGVLFISHTFSLYARAMRYTHTLSAPRIYPYGSQQRGDKETRYRNVLLVRIVTLLLSPIIYLYHSGLHTDQESYITPLTATMKQMVEYFLASGIRI